MSYNTQAAPFDDPLVRQAFTLAVDRDYICKQIGKSGQIPAGAFVSEGLSDAAEGSSFREVGGDYYDPTAGANEANLAKAKELGFEIEADVNPMMFERMGINATLQSIDFGRLRDFRVSTVETMTKGLTGLLAHRGVTVFRGCAALQNAHTVRVTPAEGETQVCLLYTSPSPRD